MQSNLFILHVNVGPKAIFFLGGKMEKAHIVPGSYLAGLFLKYKARESLVNTSFKWFQSFSI